MTNGSLGGRSLQYSMNAVASELSRQAGDTCRKCGTLVKPTGADHPCPHGKSCRECTEEHTH